MNTPNAGPYLVISNVGSEYTLLDTTQDNHLKVHVSKLIPYLEDPTKTDSTEIARKDAGEMIVADILAHDPPIDSAHQPVSRKTLQFHVRWAGYPTVEDSWEFYKDLR